MPKDEDGGSFKLSKTLNAHLTVQFRELTVFSLNKYVQRGVKLRA